ncbi:hypothetical protein ACLMJK_006785 [Lecanora helva]
MKGLFAYALMAAVVFAAPQRHARDTSNDDDCSMIWVTVYTDRPSSTTALSKLPSSVDVVDRVAPIPNVLDAPKATITAQIPSVTSINHTKGSSTSSPTSSSATPSTDSSSTLDIPARPDGIPAIPINDDHIKAPVAGDSVPAGAATYIPSKPGLFDNSDFAAWMKKQKDADLPSKWMKIAPGVYRYALGPVMPSGTDPNTVTGENIAIGFMTGGWTLDLRGVTFYVDITPENKNQRPGDMIYINQSEDFTILGGTIWIDQGEEWTQARVTSLSSPDDQGNQIATMEVEQGFNVSAWRSAGPRNQGCVDDSDSSHFSRPECNFWYVSKYDFSNLDSKRTFTASIGARAGIKEGYVLTMLVVINSFTTISTENNGKFHVKGFTSNGYVASIGLNGKVAPVFENVYYVNPPPRPGFAPRVEGPAVSWGNIGGPVYNPPGQPLAQMPGSFWQTTGCEKDLQDASNATVPN